jgi:N-acyl-D-amino-acid deacylase
MRAGKKSLEVTYDALLEDDGHQLLYFPIYNYASGTLREVGEMLRHPHAILGLGDGGAHVGTICDVSFGDVPAVALDPRQGRVHDRAGDPQAQRRARGVAGPARSRRAGAGRRADVNLIDLPALALHRPELLHDLPAGGKRFLQRATGYRATLVNGEVIAADGVVTEARGRSRRAQRLRGVTAAR